MRFVTLHVYNDCASFRTLENIIRKNVQRGVLGAARSQTLHHPMWVGLTLCHHRSNFCGMLKLEFPKYNKTDLNLH